MNSITPVNFKLWKEYLVLKFSNHPLLAANTSSFAYFVFKYSWNARAWLLIDIGIFLCIKSCIQTRRISSIFSKFSFLTILTNFACDPNPEEELRILSLLSRIVRIVDWFTPKCLAISAISTPSSSKFKIFSLSARLFGFLDRDGVFLREVFCAGAMLRFMYLIKKIASNLL